MQTAVTLRAAHADDALCLGVLATQVFLDNYATEGIRPAIAAEALRAFSTDAMRQALAAPACHVIVAECAGHLIGFAQLALGRAHDRVITESPSELERLYVQEPFTGLGIGTQLLRDAEARAAAAGTSDLWLTSWVHNLRALRFYARHGYADFGAVWWDMEGERHENRILARHLRFPLDDGDAPPP